MKISYVAGIINSCIENADTFKESVYHHSMSDVLDGLYDAVKSKKLDDLIGPLVAFESIIKSAGSVKRRNGKTYLPFEKAAEYKHSASFKKIMALTEEVATLIRERG